mmetsp:Transcript_15493/g.36916  ORF Transcript_15493/g.36916 Transcript_15493/m.36916 type:complete len:248 (-) Transcript_15493:1-744(-)
MRPSHPIYHRYLCLVRFDLIGSVATFLPHPVVCVGAVWGVRPLLDAKWAGVYMPTAALPLPLPSPSVGLCGISLSSGPESTPPPPPAARVFLCPCLPTLFARFSLSRDVCEPPLLALLSAPPRDASTAVCAGSVRERLCPGGGSDRVEWSRVCVLNGKKKKADWWRAVGCDGAHEGEADEAAAAASVVGGVPDMAILGMHRGLPGVVLPVCSRTKLNTCALRTQTKTTIAPSMRLLPTAAVYTPIQS